MVNHTSEEEKRHSPGAEVCNWECEHAQIHRHTLRAYQTGPDSLTRLKTFTQERECTCDSREDLSLGVRCPLLVYSLSDKYCFKKGKHFFKLESSNLIGWLGKNWNGTQVIFLSVCLKIKQSHVYKVLGWSNNAFEDVILTGFAKGCQVSGIRSFNDINRFCGAFGHKRTPKWMEKTNQTVVGCFSPAIHDFGECKVYHYKAVLKKNPIKAR